MGLLSNFFKNLKSAKVFGYTGWKQSTSPYTGHDWDHDIFRATVDCIATHAAKGEAKHVVVDENGRIKKVVHNSVYAKLLNQKPNPIMSGFEFKYRMVAQLETKTTAVAYVKWNGTKPEMIVPVDYQKLEFFRLVGGGYAIQFLDFEGVQTMLNLEDCIVIRKFYNERLAAGDGNAPIYKVFDMSKAADEGFIESLQVANKIRGIFKHKKAMLDPKDVEQSQEEFCQRFRNAATQGGIVTVDAMEEFVPVYTTSYSATAAQTRDIASRIYSFLRTPEEVVLSKYSEQQGLAWYESKIEPIWEQISEALTNVCFTQHERDCGNKIIFNGGALMGSSYQTRVNIISQTKELGILTVNEQRELLGYGPIEGADIREVSLNFVNADDQSKYQTGKEKEEKENDE